MKMKNRKAAAKKTLSVKPYSEETLWKNYRKNFEKLRKDFEDMKNPE